MDYDLMKTPNHSNQKCIGYNIDETLGQHCKLNFFICFYRYLETKIEKGLFKNDILPYG